MTDNKAPLDVASILRSEIAGLAAKIQVMESAAEKAQEELKIANRIISILTGKLKVADAKAKKKIDPLILEIEELKNRASMPVPWGRLKDNDRIGQISEKLAAWFSGLPEAHQAFFVEGLSMMDPSAAALVLDSIADLEIELHDYSMLVELASFMYSETEELAESAAGLLATRGGRTGKRYVNRATVSKNPRVAGLVEGVLKSLGTLK